MFRFRSGTAPTTLPKLPKFVIAIIDPERIQIAMTCHCSTKPLYPCGPSPGTQVLCDPMTVNTHVSAGASASGLYHLFSCQRAGKSRRLGDSIEILLYQMRVKRAGQENWGPNFLQPVIRTAIAFLELAYTNSETYTPQTHEKKHV